MPGYGDWTPRDRHCAFWNLLSSLTNCNWSAAQQSEVQDAIGALEICRGLEFTNATSVARELAHSAKTPMPVRVTAVQLFFELSGDRQERNASNRLAVAQKGLSAKRPTMQLVEYFSPITNLLMNAAQPLPEVDGL